MSDNIFDNRIKAKIEFAQTPFEPKNWDKMATLLDQKDAKRKPLFILSWGWIAAGGVVLLCSLLGNMFWLNEKFERSNAKNLAKNKLVPAQTKKQNAKSNTTDYKKDQKTQNITSTNEDFDAQKTVNLPQNKKLLATNKPNTNPKTNATNDKIQSKNTKANQKDNSQIPNSNPIKNNLDAQNIDTQNEREPAITKNIEEKIIAIQPKYLTNIAISPLNLAAKQIANIDSENNNPNPKTKHKNTNHNGFVAYTGANIQSQSLKPTQTNTHYGIGLERNITQKSALFVGLGLYKQTYEMDFSRPNAKTIVDAQNNRLMYQKVSIRGVEIPLNYRYYCINKTHWNTFLSLNHQFQYSHFGQIEQRFTAASGNLAPIKTDTASVYSGHVGFSIGQSLHTKHADITLEPYAFWQVYGNLPKPYTPNLGIRASIKINQK